MEQDWPHHSITRSWIAAPFGKIAGGQSLVFTETVVLDEYKGLRDGKVSGRLHAGFKILRISRSILGPFSS